MNSTEKLKAKLELPPVSHIGVVVRDMDRAVEYYSSIFGIGPFTVYEFAPKKHWLREEPCPMKLIVGHTMWGDVQLELLQPLEGKSLHKEFLDTQGEGLQHLAFHIPDYDKTFDKFIKAEFKPLTMAETYHKVYGGWSRACYFDTRGVGGVIFEICWRSWLTMM